jgi:hypothetical protein
MQNLLEKGILKSIVMIILTHLALTEYLAGGVMRLSFLLKESLRERRI